MCTLPNISNSLFQGCYTWRHNQVLTNIPKEKPLMPSLLNGFPSTVPSFLWEQASAKNIGKSEYPLLDPAQYQKMEVDLDHKLIFPAEILTTTLGPNIIMWSPSQKLSYIRQLMVQWDAAAEEAYKRKSLKHDESVAQVEQRVCSLSPNKAPHEDGVKGQALRGVNLRSCGSKQQDQEKGHQLGDEVTF